jgi:hypothetical protein
MQRDSHVQGKMATGTIESLNPAERVQPFGFHSPIELGHGWALICVLTIETPSIENVVSTVMRRGLKVGELVTWKISYLTLLPIHVTEASQVSEATLSPRSAFTRTFLTLAARQRPGVPRKDRKLERYKNILTSRLRRCPNL